MIRLKNFINGNWIESASDQFVPNRNPANCDEVLCESPQSTAEETALAIEAAHNAFPGWKETTGPKRGKILFQAVNLLQERAEELATVLTKEEGKLTARITVKKLILQMQWAIRGRSLQYIIPN